MTTAPKTRFWNQEFYALAIQTRDDMDQKVFIRTILGWTPVEGAPKMYEKAEKFAERLAEVLDLDEAKKWYAEAMLHANH